MVYLLILLTHKNVAASAVVCYAADRNELRSRVIQWLQTEVIPDGWFVKGSNFSDILHKYFKVGCKKDMVSLNAHNCSYIVFTEIPWFIYLCGSPLTTLIFKAASDYVLLFM